MIYTSVRLSHSQTSKEYAFWLLPMPSPIATLNKVDPSGAEFRAAPGKLFSPKSAEK